MTHHADWDQRIEPVPDVIWLGIIIGAVVALWERVRRA
jgi:hypothetical protein